MASAVSAPNPCLQAILLICQTRSGSGPQLIFDWPAETSHQRSTSDRQIEASTSDSSEDESDSYISATEDEDLLSAPQQHAKTAHNSTLQARVNAQSPIRNPTRPVTSAGSSTKRKLFGLEQDGLISLLAPDRTWHKRKFELSINDVVFIGRPVFANTDGFWQRQKKKKSAVHTSKSMPSDIEQSTAGEESEDAADNDREKTKSGNVHGKSELMMFHIVFVMCPPQLEHAQRTKEMYENVIKKFSRALKWVQARHDYVWEQIDKLITERQQLMTDPETAPKAVSTRLVETSSLARAIATVYNAISASRIASVSLLPGVSISLQISPRTSTSYLPSLTEPPLPPGLWLTTATEAPRNTSVSDTSDAASTVQLAKSYTLLLKSPPHKIAKDATAAGGPLAEHLPKFVAALRPTKSFWKLSNEYKISLADIQLLSRHLIYWRRAIAIPPLNRQDFYIVSPNADFTKLAEACKSYEAQFPASMPTLPKLLSVLSGVPRQFGSLIPSPDHKDIYMLLLAWLLRNGWVTQLRTFAYIKISSEIKQQAAGNMSETRSSISQSFGSNMEKSFDDPIESAFDHQRPSFVSRQSSEARASFRDAKAHKLASLIKIPQKASAEESKWLAHLHNGMLEDTGPFKHLNELERQELHHYWPMLSRHFDGNTALETISVREDLKRKVVWLLLARLGVTLEPGKAIVDSDAPNMLITVRHW